MKTLLITYDFPPIISGISTFFCNLWSLLPARNNLILAPKTKGYKETDKGTSFNIIRYPLFPYSKIIRLVILLFYVLTLIARERINLLICEVPLSLGFIGFIFKKIFNLPYCIFYYGGEFEKYKRNPILIKLLQSILKNAHWIITNSEYTSFEISSNYAINPERVIKIMPAIDVEKFKPGLDCTDLRKKFNLEGKKILLTVCRLVKRKGIDSVIKALPKVIQEIPEVVYLVVGTGREEAYLKKLTKEMGVERNIVFIGEIADDELPRYYNLCDIYVMPNRQTKGEEILEGFGISFIEASACAKPVIGGVSGGIRDAILDGKTGLLVDPDNIDMLSDVILRLLKDDMYARQLGENGRERIEKEFRWQERAEKLKNLLYKISS